MKNLIVLLSLFFLLQSCSGKNTVSADQNDTVPLQKVLVNVSIVRFDIDFSNYLKNPTKNNKDILESKYKDFLPAFGRITINNSDSYKNEFYLRLQRYFGNEMLSSIYNHSLEVFNDLNQYEKELSEADNFIAQNFNGKHLPALYMHVSGFKENVMVLNNIISISADKYLGEDFPLYKQFFENYQLIRMKPKLITRDYIKAWILSDLIQKENDKTLLVDMINEGKTLYVLSQILQNWNEEDLIDYNANQLIWVKENESKIWKAVVQQNHLYEQNELIKSKYMNDAPYTATLTTDSPGRAGAWVGWQIVNSYMANNKILLADLFNIDAQTILKNSGYNP
ncbi:MAG: hypothetical protein ACLVKO_12035 [Dysgonomonas sp.]